jgi:hypothetical protein
MIARDPSYSPDVELDHQGRVVLTRDIQRGQIIQIPMALMPYIRKGAGQPAE